MVILHLVRVLSLLLMLTHSNHAVTEKADSLDAPLLQLGYDHLHLHPLLPDRGPSG